MNTTIGITIAVLLPAIILGGAALVVLMLEAFCAESVGAIPSRVAIGWLTMAAFLGAALAAAVQWANLGPLPNSAVIDGAGMIIFDPFTAFLTIVFSVGGILAMLFSVRYLERVGSAAGEYYCLVLFSATGAYLMASAHHLIMVFLGLEILSVAVYPLAGFFRRDPRSNEASLKYFLLGAFASSFLFYGIALIYGAVGLHFQDLGAASARLNLGSLRFDTLRNFVVMGGASHGQYAPFFWGGIALLLVGFCFKSALAPFHMWTPDVYDGSPTPITAYMSAVVKAAAFAPFFRFFIQVMGRAGDSPQSIDVYNHWVLIVAAIAMLTMTWGNLAAVAEPSMKRMLAYSSVAHAGYIVVALVSESLSALLYYTLVYTLMVVGSFGAASMLRRRGGEETLRISEWTGAGLRHPWLGAAMSIFMFGLAGFPPTAGFMGKFYIFRAALETGNTAVHHNGYVAVVVVALINSLISVYYYLRVVVTLYRPATEEADDLHLERSAPAAAALAFCAIGILVLGIFPDAIIGPLSRSFAM